MFRSYPGHTPGHTPSAAHVSIALRRWLRNPNKAIKDISLAFVEKRDHPYNPEEIASLRQALSEGLAEKR